MKKILLYGGIVLGAGLFFRLGWDAGLRFARIPPDEIYFSSENKDCNQFQRRLDLECLDFSLMKMEASGRDKEGNEYFGKIYPLEKKAYIEFRGFSSRE
jgi:hypothetical protein